MRRAARTDANQAAIVQALRQAGASVLSLAAIGQGCPDLLVARAEQTYLIEVKTQKGKLTPDQVEFHQLWRGRIEIARTVEEALGRRGGINVKALYPGGGEADSFGIITAPNHRGIPQGIQAGQPYGVDLGCLQGPAYVKRLNLDAVAKWLPTIGPYRANCLWLAGGDVVEDAQATLDAFEEFKGYFQGWPLAYVAQNGAESLPIPEDCVCVFIGGDTKWKESYEAVTVIQRAQALGKMVHIGRVNWWDRYELFAALPGSEEFTFDGNRARYDGRDKTLAAWKGYQGRRAIRQLALPDSYRWRK